MGLVRDASEGCFGRAVQGYADLYTERWLILYQGTPIGTRRFRGSFWQGTDWYVSPPRVVLAGLYQGTLIGEPNV